jgi:ABC-2 type transport system permease protein
MKHARAILWAQWRTLLGVSRRGGVGWSAAIGVVWYGFWLLASVTAARLIASPAGSSLVKTALPGTLLIVFLYWQVVPLLMAATGASLELRKLQVYPIPVSQLFAIEAMLRVTAGIEMVLLLLGISAGIAMNPELPKWGVLAVVLYLPFNLFLAVGLRDLLMRTLARKRVREAAIILLVMASAAPRLLIMWRSARTHVPMRFSGDAWLGWPWSAAANMFQGSNFLESSAILAAWTLAAAAFGRWQFNRTLSFDAEAAASDTRPAARRGAMEWFYRWPSAVFRDPLAALVEKEIRILARSPRFRLVFLMGFTIALVFWLSMSVGRGGSHNEFVSANYLTVVSVYSLMLLCQNFFWNAFGFDRLAVQVYFLAPVEFSQVLIGKNLTAVFFIALEISAITIVCGFMAIPLDPIRLAEAYSVAGVITLFLLAAGNLLSVHQARGVNLRSSFGSGGAGRLQASLLLIYPIAFIPAGFAYLARWAFDAHPHLAFFGVLAFDAAAGIVIYKIALDSAVTAAERRKEEMIAALSAGVGPIAA